MRRLFLIAFGVFLGLIVLEVALQLAALVVGAPARRLPSAWLTANRRVLCVGDSSTYGVYLSDRTHQAYPAQLEALWNERVKSPPIEVVNIGYPGTNSSRLRREFRRYLDLFAPDLVIVMIGTNDFWTTPVDFDESRGFLARAATAIREHSRVYQLVYMLRRAFSSSRLELVSTQKVKRGGDATFRYGDEEIQAGWREAPLANANFGPALDDNLRSFERDARETGTRLVFMTYPSRMSNYGQSGTHVRTVAREDGTRLVDLAAVFDPLCPKEPCPKWILPDHHPTADGYRLIAETLVAELRDEILPR